jgi:hypothetical protein
MSTSPLTQWLAFGKSSLAIFKQLGESSSAGFKEAGAQLPTGQAQFAQIIKSTLEASKEWNDLQAAAFTSLLQTQLSVPNSDLASKTLKDLMGLHLEFSNDVSAQRKGALNEIAERANSCIDDLRKAQNKDDIAMTVAGFLGDVGTMLRADAEQTFTLMNSASAASTILTHKALDDMIGAA